MNTTSNTRKCRKCGHAIPASIKIEGITKSLKNRKFCLDCSPYKKHNTHPSDPGEPKGRRKSKERNRQLILSTYKRGLERKAMLIQKSGGKCQICGYCKCNRSLSFHHRDPAKKVFGMSLNNLWSRSLIEVIAEAEKCDLLCLNCHMEVENQESDIVKAVNEKYGTDF